jgi:hypothetical protein
VLLLGSGATRSAQCNILLMHADQMFAFEIDPVQTAGFACRSSNMEMFSAGPSGRVERMKDPIARIDSIVLDRAENKNARERLTGTAKVTVLKSVQGRIGIRVSMLEGKESKIMFRPIEMKVGVNDLVFDFPALESTDSYRSDGQKPKQVKEGPMPMAFDIVRESDSSSSENIRSLNQLLSNTVAVLVNVIHDPNP